MTFDTKIISKGILWTDMCERTSTSTLQYHFFSAPRNRFSFWTRTLCRGVSGSGCLRGVWGRCMNHMSPACRFILGKFILNELVCKFDRIEICFSLLRHYILRVTTDTYHHRSVSVSVCFIVIFTSLQLEQLSTYIPRACDVKNHVQSIKRLNAKWIISGEEYIYGLVQERRNPIALAVELYISLTNPSICKHRPFCLRNCN